VRHKDNLFSREHGLNDRFAFVYSGTLGRRHNPHLLVRLAETVAPYGSIVVVVAQGVAMKQLYDAKAARRLDALRLLPLQPAEVLPDVLATADVLIAMIESDASTFGVPSKVPSYMCAGRPILLVAPKENLAARTVARAAAGIVVDPADEVSFLAAARRLRDDARLRAELAANGRAYAEETFDISRITDEFEAVLTGAPAARQVAHNELVRENSQSF
jgi:putative colanic acid biosynthesis glycosyltransferase WcaI